MRTSGVSVKLDKSCSYFTYSRWVDIFGGMNQFWLTMNSKCLRWCPQLKTAVFVWYCRNICSKRLTYYTAKFTLYDSHLLCSYIWIHAFLVHLILFCWQLGYFRGYNSDNILTETFSFSVWLGDVYNFICSLSPLTVFYLVDNLTNDHYITNVLCCFYLSPSYF